MSDLSLAGGLWHVVHTDICLFALLVLGFGSATGCGETYAGRTGGTGGTAGDVGDGAIQEIPQPATWDFLDSQQSIRNSDDLLKQRAEMIETVFKGPIPTRLPDAVEAITDEYYPGLAVERLTIETDDFASIVYLIQPPLWTGGLALYHQGHAGDFRTNGEDTIQGLLDAGHQVLAFAMPMRGMNTHPYENNSHNQLVDSRPSACALRGTRCHRAQLGGYDALVLPTLHDRDLGWWVDHGPYRWHRRANRRQLPRRRIVAALPA
jgi:hypothetical protein